MKQPKFTEQEMRDWARRFFDNWAHLKDMADGLQRIATVLERMDKRTVDDIERFRAEVKEVPP